jgi:SpoVK/Ycf46/Vps4 family AAA+-type ATPase
LCTTNFIRQLGPQLTNRPGRFNKLIKVLPPTEDEVFALIKDLSGIVLSDDQKKAFQGLPLSPDHVIEALLRHDLEGIPLEKAAMDVIKERDGLMSWEDL